MRTEFLKLVTKAKFGPEDETRVADTALFVQRLYEGAEDRNDGTKPIVHILRVANRLLTYGVRDADTILAALLHDAVEDHPETLARLGTPSGMGHRTDAIIYIEKNCKGNVAEIVNHTTRKKLPTPHNSSPEEKIRHYLTYVRDAAQHLKALLIKVADVSDNTQFHSPELTQRVYSMEKYWEAIPILQEGVARNKNRIVEIGGYALYLRLTLDLIVARRRAAVWKKLKPVP